MGSMNFGSSAALPMAIAALHCCALLASAATLNVGGSTGWTIGGNYAAWAAAQSFAAGDILFFAYAAGAHDVVEVDDAGYTACSAVSPIATHSDGNTSVTLSSTGTRYFLCSFPGHCTAGMKLAVAVGATPSPPAPSPGTNVGTPTSAPSPAPPAPPSPSAPASTPTSIGAPASIPTPSLPPSPSSTSTPTPTPSPSLSPSPASANAPVPTSSVGAQPPPSASVPPVSSPPNIASRVSPASRATALLFLSAAALAAL